MSKHFLFCILTVVSLFLTACGEKEKEITVQSIAISQPSAELKIGETLNLKATVSPSNASYDGITWTSTRTTVATVSSFGLVSALAEGNTTITAMAGGKTASCSVTVVKGFVEVSTISLNKESLELVEGDSETLTATVSPNDATDKTVSWSSSNDAVATVKDGTITAVKVGEATITAKAGEKTASCNVVVAKKVIPVESIELNKTELALVEGDIETLTATISPEDATDKTISWTSSKESIATVKDGLVTAISEGEATITAKAGEKTASCKVVVAKKVIPVESIELNKTELELKKGESSTLSATVLPTNATNPTVSWFSSNSEIASVNQNGKVTALSGGVTIITAKAGDKTAECKVSISVPATSLSLDKTSIEMHPSETIQLVATILPDDMTDSIIWNSSDPHVASVDDSGKVSAHNKGITMITVTAGNVSASCEVKVSANNDVIAFMDPNVKAKLVAAFDSDGDGELSYEEAAAVSSGDELKAAFGAIKTYKSFDEFKYFTGITTVPNTMFSNWNLITSIQFSDNVKEIGESAFANCKNLNNVMLPSSVTSIGKKAFQGCSSLSSIVIPDGVTGCLDHTFYGCTSLESFSIPDGVLSLYYTFYGCTGLKQITIPNSVTTIDSDAFYGCSSISSISIPESVTYIGINTFNGCTSLTSINLPESLKKIKDSAFAGCVSLESITIPSGVAFISSYSFMDCSGLKTLILREGVERIGTSTFMGCSSLTSVSIPESLTEIGFAAFARCSSLTNFYIPESVTSIGVDAFSGCSNLKSIEIPESVSMLYDRVFSDCSSLISIIIPCSVTGIENNAFQNCSSLSNVIIPESVSSIGDGAFYGCTSLTSIIIPESVTSIGRYSFADCSSLISITFLPVTPPQAVSSMFDNTNNAPIYVPSGSVEAYKTAEGWSDYANRIQAISQ